VQDCEYKQSIDHNLEGVFSRSRPCNTGPLSHGWDSGAIFDLPTVRFLPVQG